MSGTELDEVIRRFLIVGNVQGVFFRHSTRLEAGKLGIRGFARNLADGSVEVIAQGPASSVERLREWLGRGPAQARVDEVRDLQADPGSALPEGFHTY